MSIHHSAPLILLSIGYFTNRSRCSPLFLSVHTAPEIFLESARAANFLALRYPLVRREGGLPPWASHAV